MPSITPTSLTPHQSTAVELLKQSFVIDQDEPFYSQVVAVGRVLAAMGIPSVVYNRPLEYSGGLIGAPALEVDGEVFDVEGKVGWRAIARASMRRYHKKGRCRYLKSEQECRPPVIELSPSAIGDVNEANRIDRLEAEIGAWRLSQATPMPLDPRRKTRAPRL